MNRGFFAWRWRRPVRESVDELSLSAARMAAARLDSGATIRSEMRDIKQCLLFGGGKRRGAAWIQQGGGKGEGKIRVSRTSYIAY
jgi:hypothetical protein